MTTTTALVGGTISTAEQLDALPLGSVVVHDSDVDPPGIAVMQRSVHTGAWYLPAAIERVEPLLPVTVLFVPGEQPRRSVEDARAEGWDVGYRQGVADERTSQEWAYETVSPGRLNPYRLTPSRVAPSGHTATTRP